MKVYDITINDDDETGIELISFVDNPAMEVKGLALSKTEELHLAMQEDKMIFTSAVIVPDKLILRRDPNGGEYYIRFSVEQIERIRDKFFKQGNLKASNRNHIAHDTVKAHLIESWSIADPEKDKALALGFEGLPAGTLMASYKVEDEALWKEIKSGEINGFSLEGLFAQVEAKLHEEPEFDVWLNELVNSLTS